MKSFGIAQDETVNNEDIVTGMHVRTVMAGKFEMDMIDNKWEVSRSLTNDGVIQIINVWYIPRRKCTLFIASWKIKKVEIQCAPLMRRNPTAPLLTEIPRKF